MGSLTMRIKKLIHKFEGKKTLKDVITKAISINNIGEKFCDNLN